MSLSTAASIRYGSTDAAQSTAAGPQSSVAPTNTNVAYNFTTSKIVRAAVAAGIIVLALTGLILFFKITSWIRYHQRMRRQRDFADKLFKEEQAAQYEVAAWSEAPGVAPILYGKEGKQKKKQREKDKRALRRGGGNAYAVQEWEGVAQ